MPSKDPFHGDEDTEYVGVFECSEEDKKHIRRLQALRESGAVNMVTELRRGLEEVWPEDHTTTYNWVKDNWKYYMSGNWVDEDLDDL